MIVVFDCESQRSAADVGGWGHIEKMGLAVAVAAIYRHTWSDTPMAGLPVTPQQFLAHDEPEAGRLIEVLLAQAAHVVSFNGEGFDFKLLSPYDPTGVLQTKLATPGWSIDLCTLVARKLGRRVSLDSLAQATLGHGKTADGLQSLAWWKAGEHQRVRDYCAQDVAVTLDLYHFAATFGYLVVRRSPLPTLVEFTRAELGLGPVAAAPPASALCETCDHPKAAHSDQRCGGGSLPCPCYRTFPLPGDRFRCPVCHELECACGLRTPGGS